MITNNDLYTTLNTTIPEGMDPLTPIPEVFATTNICDQGDLIMIKPSLIPNFPKLGLGTSLDKPYPVIKGETARNDHTLIPGVDTEAYWTSAAGTDYQFDLGVLTVTKGEVYLFHTAEHEPHKITPNSGPVLFRRQRQMSEIIEAVAD